MLNGYFDASGKGAKDIFVLAGYISTAERWEKFAEDWDAELKGGREKKRQPIKVFKLRKMDLTSSGQLKRCAIFNNIAHEHAIARLAIVVDVAAVKRMMESSWWRYIDKSIEPTDTAYWYGFRLATETFHIERKKHPELNQLSGPLNFTFDQENESDNSVLVRAWEYLYATSSPEKRELLGNMPHFAKDDLVMPLQAADLLAGLTRKIAASGQSIKKLPTPWSDEGRKPILTISMEHYENDIKRNLDRVMGAQFIKQVSGKAD